MAKLDSFIANQFGIGFIQKVARKIRISVFVEEQGISINDELDNLDKESWHFVSFIDGSPVSTARTYLKNKTTLHIGRVATIKDQRGKNYSKDIFTNIEKFALNNGFDNLFLSSQLSAQGFYQKLGYEPRGDVFLDAGIEHIDMVKTLRH